MMNCDYKEAGLDRADTICLALNAVEELVCAAPEGDLHILDGRAFHALLDVLNHQLALALRDARSEEHRALMLLPEEIRFRELMNRGHRSPA